MDGRIRGRPYTRCHTARRQLLPAPGIELVFPAGVSERPTWQASANGPEQRPFCNPGFSLRRRHPVVVPIDVGTDAPAGSLAASLFQESNRLEMNSALP